VQNTFESDGQKKTRVTNVQSAAAANGTAAPAAAVAAPSPASPQVHAPVVAAPSASVNLLDWDDEPQPIRSAAPAVVSSGFRLGQIDLSPTDFQQRWGALPEVLSHKLFTLAMVPDATSEVESSMRAVMVLSPLLTPLLTPSPSLLFHRSTRWHLAPSPPLLE
jgi:hypothetical protein